jgi:hypothetical protein
MSEFATNKNVLMTAEDSNYDRMYAEQRKMEARFNEFQFIGSRGTGRIERVYVRLVTNLRNSYGVDIMIPEKYPFVMPILLPNGWTLKDDAPHTYPSAPRSLCVMKPAQWHADMTIAFMTAKAAIWLNKYDCWRETGSWPGAQQKHGLGGLIEWLVS